MKPILIALYGKSGAGKDTILDMFLEKHPTKLNKVLRDTTRPKRPGEGANSYLFQDSVSKLDLHRYVEFNYHRDWFYGTQKNSVLPEVVNIGSFSEVAVQQIIDSGEFNMYPVLIGAETKVRLIRSLLRDDSDVVETIRRFSSELSEEGFVVDPFFIVPNNSELKDVEGLIDDILLEVYFSEFLESRGGLKQ